MQSINFSFADNDLVDNSKSLTRQESKYQKQQSVMKPLKINFLFHLIAFATYGYSVYWQEVHPHNALLRKPQGAFAGKWKWLTYWDLILQFVFFGLCLVCDIEHTILLKTKKAIKTTLLDKTRDHFFHGLAVPTAMFVAVNFWTLYAWDRNLVYPVHHKKIYPPWLNHTTHSCVLIFALIESYLCYHRPPHPLIGLGLMYALFAAYGLWTLYFGIVVDYWIYRIMEVLSWKGRTLIMFGAAPLLCAFYCLGAYLHRKFWPKDRIQNIPRVRFVM